MNPGDLVQVRKGVQGQGDVGIVLGPIKVPLWRERSYLLLEVLFHDGTRNIHPGNLQKPDGRTRRKL
jgi:hypothetical protein